MRSSRTPLCAHKLTHGPQQTTCAVAVSCSRDGGPAGLALVRPVMLLPQLVHDVMLARVFNHL